MNATYNVGDWVFYRGHHVEVLGFDGWDVLVAGNGFYEWVRNDEIEVVQ